MPRVKTTTTSTKVAGSRKSQKKRKKGTNMRRDAREFVKRIRIRDPYLVDSIEEYARLFEELRTETQSEHLQEIVYFLCELSRDITIRLIPFSTETRKIIQWAKDMFEDTVVLLEDYQTNERINQFAGNIKKRVADYTEFLDQS